MLKRLLIVLVTTVVSLALHAQIPMGTPSIAENLSFVARHLSFIGTVTLFFLTAYFAIASLFLRFEGSLPGRRITRGLTFGLLVGGVWCVGMLEASLAFGSDLVIEALTGLFDLVPIVLLCLLLSAFLVAEQPVKRHVFPGAAVNAVIFLVVFGGGRVVRYFADPGGYYLDNLWLTVSWTALFALVIALNYIVLKDAGAAHSPLASALRFTFVLFGLPYALFVYFIPLVFKDMFMAASTVLAADLLLVFLASWICYGRKVAPR